MSKNVVAEYREKIVNEVNSIDNIWMLKQILMIITNLQK